jgi:ABC-2 type transport system permease protein
MTVHTHLQGIRDLRLAARRNLLPVRVSGRLAGFGNLLTKEFGEWFHTRRWLLQLFIWLTIIDGVIGFLYFVLPVLANMWPNLKPVAENIFAGLPPEVGGAMHYYSIVAMTGTIGTIILTQDAVIREKQSGTAAWILSKPVSRPAFLLTKLLSNTIGTLIFIVALPALIVLGEIFLATQQMVPLLPFLTGTGVVFLALFFYLSLVILLGVLFDSNGSVLGIAFGIMFVGVFFSKMIPPINYILPVSMDGIALELLQGMPLPGMLISQVIATAVLSILFILVALWKFQHKEL